ncbi:MAG: winged helix-turn-helix domain-containing protein [Candidatus Dojkabacteria bacterium]|nr:winged helix-turn-helix domain-containing protein [Candidatus Dojkabacteria bacterium]
MAVLVQKAEWLEQLQKDLPDLVARGDHFNVWGLPFIGITKFLFRLSPEDKNSAVVNIDTRNLAEDTSESFFQLLNAALMESLSKADLSNDPGSTVLDTNRLIGKITEKRTLCIIVDTLDDLHFLDENILATFKGMFGRFENKLVFGFVSSHPLAEDPHFGEFPEFIDFATHREYIVPPIPKQRTPELISAIKSYTRFPISSTLGKKIFDLSGGILGIITSITRSVEARKLTTITRQLAVEDEPTLNRVKIILSSFTNEEINQLSSIADGADPTALTLSRYIRESGILDRKKIQSSLIEHYLKSIQPIIENSHSKDTLEINFETGEVIIEGKPLADLLTETEMGIMKCLISRKGRLTTREDLAREIWGKNYSEKYSDWALDKLISRIRSKIGDTRRPHRYIVTVKGRGFLCRAA